MKNINLNRQKLGLEDLLFGLGTVLQTRGGQEVSITKINVGNMPFDETQSLIEWAQSVNLEELGAMTTQLNSLYQNISTLQSVGNNIGAITAVNAQIVPNLTEILNVDTLASQVTADKATITAMKLAVETLYDTFDDRFLGAKTTDPTLDNDGNALLTGAMYFNSSSNVLKIYTGTLWATIPQVFLSSLLDVQLTSITTGDILTWNGSKWVNTRTPKFDRVQLNGGSGTAGTIAWNNTELTCDIALNSNVTLQIGQEEVIYCKNNTGSTIANGRPVMAVGTNGNSGNILVDLHDGTKANAKRIVGIATEDLLANGFGFVTRNGKVRGINTTGSTYGETWANGDILYVKATGNLTNVTPADSALKMPIAFVIHAHTNGTLMVRTDGLDENMDKDLIATKANSFDVYTKTQSDASLLLKANVASPAFTGTPTINGEVMGGSYGFKNYIINGNFDIWQYKAAGLTYPQVSVGYGSDDRWSNGNVGSTKTHSQVACTDTERALFNASYFSRTVVTSVAGANNYCFKQQKIENITRLAGKTVTLSFWAKADSAKKIGVSIGHCFGTGGTPTTQINRILDNTINLTSEWQKFSITFTNHSIVGKTLGTNGVHTSYTELTFWMDAGSSLASTYITNMVQQSGTFDIAQVQLEEGSVATPFENRPYGLELSLCQRYYEVVSSQPFTGQVNIYDSSSIMVEFKYVVPKRISPSIVNLTSANNTMTLFRYDDRGVTVKCTNLDRYNNIISASAEL